MNALSVSAAEWPSYLAGYEAGVLAGLRGGWQVRNDELAAQWAEVARRVHVLAGQLPASTLDRLRGYEDVPVPPMSSPEQCAASWSQGEVREPADRGAAGTSISPKVAA